MERRFDIMNWDGTLSPSEFRIAALAFIEKWNRFISGSLPQWSWALPPKRPWIAAHEAEGYLSLENVFLRGSSKVQSHFDEMHRYDFHIVYSTSYRVPVLYFRAYCSDGQPLVLDDIEKDLPGNSAKLLMESKWTFITQEEHPYLNRPWYTLHPCGTGEWMKLLLSTDASRDKHQVEFENYLVSWLSVVGQVVGLRIPFEMLKDSGSCS